MADEEKKDDTPNRIMVYLRVRNAKPGEISAEAGTKELMEVSPDKKVVNVEGGKTYNFDHIFYGKEGHNHEIYQIVGRPVVENIFKGYWGALMVYGQTGTGKSFTMCNFDKGNEGIIPGAMQDVFNKAALETDRTVTVTFSFIQIYLDKLQDLFNPNCKEELKLTRDAKGVAFPGIVERVCTNYEDFKANYDDGHQYRVITATKMNPESSRGHAALFIQVKSVPKDPSGEVRNGKLFMIDLAGYERFSKTGVQEGLMKEEAKTINASLLALGNVVQSLAEKSEHIPWRNAKLTRMLEDAIGGKAKCSIILTAGPSNEHNHETLGTLYFGSRAMSVKTTSGPMIVMDYKKLSAKLQELLDLAYSKINSLELSAQKRALEREEAEVSLNNERASLKQRQEAEVKKLMDSGASQDQIAALIAANKKEEELLSEQQAEQRELLNAQQDEDLQHVIKRGEQEEEERTEHVKTGMNQEVQKLQRELARTKEELERMKIKAKEADAEARRLLTELNDAKVQLAKNGITLSVDDDDLLGGRNMSPVAQTGNKALLATPEIRKELDRRVESVKRMLEETHELRLQEVEEPLQEEIARLKGLYEEAQATVDAQLQAQKDALSAMYEAELEKARTTANDVQEKLKKNHMTVKQSYQKQKEALQDENENLTRQLAELQARVGGDPGTAGAAVPARAGVPSLAEVMIMKKQTERKVDEMQQLVNDLKADLDYIQTEKAALERQLKEYEPTQGEDRLKPAQVRKLKEDHDALKAEKDKLEKELFKLRAEQALSGPQKVTNGGGDEDEAVDDLDAKEDMFGDAEGMKVFCDKVLKFPYYMGKEKVNSTHEHVLSTLATDLDEYRRSMKIRIILMGSQGTGKTSAVKCMTTTQPLIRSAPDVQPTVHPLIQVGTVEDIMTSKSEWHQLYVKFEDLQQENKSASILGRMASVVGVGGNGVADPAKIHVDLVDFPGSDKFWRGMPPSFLPGKNVCYTVVYNLNQPLDVIRDEIGRQLKIIHASAHRNYPKSLGGDAPRVAVCLLGTHRESLRETKDTPVLALLNRIISSLGDTFFTLRGEDTYGLVLLGNFAVSCSEWSVLGNRGPKHPTNFRDLFTFIATTATRLYDTRPSALLPTVKDSTSHTTYTLQAGDDAPLEGPAEKTSTMNETDKRLRKGIVTLLTALAREVKVRWVMSDAEMRTLIAHHIGVAENTKGAINAINYIMRELICRGIVMPLPGPLYEPKYLPKHKDDYPQDFTPLPRDGAIVLDPLRLVVIYSAFISLQHIQTVPKDILKDKNVAFFDVNALEKLDTAWQNGIVTQSVVQLVENRFVGLTCSDAKLMIELLCIMGFGLPLKQEPAMIAPMHFAKPMAVGLVDYISYLLSNHGDGIGRKYKLNTLPAAFVARLQTVLIPFSHAPTKDVPFVEQNWSDASYLAFDKARLKWGIFGSKIVKDAVFASQLPVRGILKVEGDYLYVAITARGPSTAAMMAAVRPVLNAVHHHITALCRREFRGVTASFQEMVIAGCETKRPKLTVGIPHILDRLGATADEIAVQVGAISTMSDPKGTEIDVALAALPMLLKFDSE